MNVPSRISLWCFAVSLLGVAALASWIVAALIILRFREPEFIEAREALYAVNVPFHEPVMWGALFVLLGVAPIVIAHLYHGKRTFVEKYKDEWRRHKDLKDQVRQFRTIFLDGDVQAVMERMRQERLRALANIRTIADDRPEKMNEEGARKYRIAVGEAGAEVARLESEIERARNLAAEPFGLRVPPVSYYLCPKPDCPPKEAVASQEPENRKSNAEVLREAFGGLPSHMGHDEP